MFEVGIVHLAPRGSLAITKQGVENRAFARSSRSIQKLLHVLLHAFDPPPPLDPSKPPLLIDQAVSLSLLTILDQTTRGQQCQHVHCNKPKEAGEYDIQEPIGKRTERDHTATQSCCGSCGCAGVIADEQCRIVVPAALEAFLEHGDGVRSLGVPHGLQVLVGFKSRVPDSQANDQCEGRGENDTPAVGDQVGAIGPDEQGRDRQEKGDEHDNRVHDRGCSLQMSVLFAERSMGGLGLLVPVKGVLSSRRWFAMFSTVLLLAKLARV